MIQKLKLALKKEFLYYLITLVLLTVIMHFDILTNPSSRLEIMQEKENYSHPFFYSFIVYSVFLILRKTIDFISGIFKTKNN